MRALPLYVYGIAAGDPAPVAEAVRAAGSVTGAPPVVQAVGSRLLILGAHDGSEILQTRRRMLAHARVLEAAMHAATVLPMRFGHVVEDLAELEARLAAHDDRIAARIAALRGQAEFGLRVSVPREAALAALLAGDPALVAWRDRLEGAGHGAHFERIDLGRHVAEALERRRTTAQRHLAAELPALCSDHVLKTPGEDVELLRAECLLPVERAGPLAARMEAAAAALGVAPGAEVSVRLVGPAPAFHFVDLALGSESAHRGDARDEAAA